MNKLLNLKHARHPEQTKKMKELSRKGLCPFCPEQLEKYHNTPIIKKGKFWTLTFNDYPYDGTEKHFLIISNRHLTHLKDISEEAAKELIKINSDLTKKEKISGGTFFMRFGDTNLTGATISHLHAHLIIGEKNRKGEKKEQLRIMAGYKKSPVKKQGK